MLLSRFCVKPLFEVEIQGKIQNCVSLVYIMRFSFSGHVYFDIEIHFSKLWVYW